MVEILISLLVLAFGVLGMAGLQLQAINNSELARYNGRAAIEASSIAAAMRGNTSYWGTPTTTISVQGTTVSGGPSAFTGSCLYPNTCTASQMAYYDLAYWGQEIANNLPGGHYQIACDLTVSPAVCSVTIFWFEKNIAMNGTTAASGPLANGTTQTHSYQTMVSVL